MKNGKLPDSTGFFFGVSDGREAEDLQFIARARQALSEGKTVFYDLWW